MTKILTALLACSVGLPSQANPTVDLSPSRPLIIDCSHGSVFFEGPDQPSTMASQLTWIRYGATADIVASIPLKALGSVERLSDTRLLVCGLAPDDKGRICLVKLDPITATVEIQQTENIGDIVPAELAWNEALGGLAIYDLKTEALFMGPFQGSQLPSQSSLILIGTSNEVPPMSGEFVLLGSCPSGFTIKSSRIAPQGRYTYDNGVWQFAWNVQARPAYWDYASASTKSHVGPVLVKGLGLGFTPPQSFEIRMGSTVVASGTQTTADTWVSVPAPIEFFDYPGAEFTIESAAGGSVAPSQAFRPLVRYGAPWTFGDSIKIGRGVMDPSRLFVGSGNVPISCQINLPHEVGAPAVETSYNAYLGIGFGWRGQGVPADPVTVIGDQALLTTSLMLEFPNTAQYWPIGGMSTGLPVPQDPGLEGLVVLFQWYIQSVSHPSDIAVSDVFGARIFAGGAQRAALSAPTRSAPAEGHEAARARFQQQLNRSVREGTAERFGALRGTVERRLRAR